jgi:hypothetical protein
MDQTGDGYVAPHGFAPEVDPAYHLQHPANHLSELVVSQSNGCPPGSRRFFWWHSRRHYSPTATACRPGNAAHGHLRERCHADHGRQL